MFNFFKRKKDPEVPEWAVFFSPQEYQTFLDEVANWFQVNQIKVSIEDGIVIPENKEDTLGNFGLANLAQVCGNSSIKTYPEIIDEHFQKLMRMKEQSRVLDEQVRDFEVIRHYLGVRFYPKFYLENLGSELTLTQAFAGDLLEVPVFDLPETVQNVQPGQMETWGISEASLFQIARANTLKNYPPAPRQAIMGENVPIWVVEADHFFSANVLWEMEKHPELNSPSGTLFIIPNRHTLLFHPIRNLQAAIAANNLISLGRNMFLKGPGSLTPELFWFYEGKFEVLPVIEKEDGLTFVPPQKFVDILNQLKAPEDNN